MQETLFKSISNDSWKQSPSAKVLKMETHLYGKPGPEISIMWDISNYHGWMVLGSSGGGKALGCKEDAKIQILMNLYKETELHSFQTGRNMDAEPYIDDFQKGTEKLKAKLPKWLKKTLNSRGLQDMGGKQVPPMVDPANDVGESDSDDEHEEDPQCNGEQDLLRFMAAVVGELVIDGIGSDNMENIMDEMDGLGVDSDLESSDSEEED